MIFKTGIVNLIQLSMGPQRQLVSTFGLKKATICKLKLISISVSYFYIISQSGLID